MTGVRAGNDRNFRPALLLATKLAENKADGIRQSERFRDGCPGFSIWTRLLAIHHSRKSYPSRELIFIVIIFIIDA